MLEILTDFVLTRLREAGVRIQVLDQVVVGDVAVVDGRTSGGGRRGGGPFFERT